MTTSNDDKTPPPQLSVLCGFLMGGADAIPGVSGGTIALILGIYDRFIDSLHSVLRAPMALRTDAGRKQIATALRFLVPLGVGVLVAYYLATKLLVGKSENPGLMIREQTAPICYAFFFGLVLLSLREPWKRISHRSGKHVVAAVLGCAAAAIFCGLPHATGAVQPWMLVLGGAGAISMMVMPGVSGSLLLVILGQYQYIVTSIHERNLAVFGVFALGILLGALTFIPTLRFLLKRHHDIMMAVLTGMMAGSLRALWPWKDGYDIKTSELANTGIGEQVPWVLLAVVVGAGVVGLLAMLERKVAGSPVS